MRKRQTTASPMFRMARKAAATRAMVRTRARSDPSSHQTKFEAMEFPATSATTMMIWRMVSTLEFGKRHGARILTETPREAKSFYPVKGFHKPIGQRLHPN